MSTSPIQPDASDVEDLVAYLDGELSADECRRVERRLASNEAYRRQLTELEQAWTALDALPPAKVTDDFARTTIEMVCVAAERELQQESTAAAVEARRRKNWYLVGGVALALAAFGATWAYAPSRDRALLADLPVIAQLDVLRDVGDIEFLRGLETLDVEPPVRNTATEVTPSTNENWSTVENRRTWVMALPDSEKADLAAKFERFERELSPEDRDRLRKLWRDIDTAGDRKRLETTLASYGAWLQSRSPAERVELRDPSLTTEKRLERVERLIEQSQRSVRRKLSLDDERALQDTIFALVEERRQELMDEVRRGGNARPEERVGRRSVAEVAWVIIGREMQNERRREQFVNRLTASLSEGAQAHLDGLNEWQRRQQMGRWIFEALAPKAGPQNLERFFAEDLTNEQREYLLGLPRAEMQEQLQQLYARSQVGLPNEGIIRGFFRGGPPGRRDWNRGENRRGRDRRDRDGRERDGRDRRDGQPDDVARPRFDGPPPGRGPGGPDGPPDRFGPPPRDDWRGPSGRPFGPPPPPGEGGPPPQRPIGEDQPI